MEPWHQRSDLSPQQRRQDVANLLARAIVRLKRRSAPPEGRNQQKDRSFCPEGICQERSLVVIRSATPTSPCVIYTQLDSRTATST